VIGCSEPGRLGTISGVIEVSNGGGASGCANCTHPDPGQVQFLSPGVVERTITTAANGRFSVRLRAGQYVVQAPSPCDAPKTGIHKVVGVQAPSLAPIGPPEAYAEVPRRVLGIDGQIRPLHPPDR